MEIGPSVLLRRTSSIKLTISNNKITKNIQNHEGCLVYHSFYCWANTSVAKGVRAYSRQYTRWKAFLVV